MSHRGPAVVKCFASWGHCPKWEFWVRASPSFCLRPCSTVLIILCPFTTMRVTCSQRLGAAQESPVRVCVQERLGLPLAAVQRKREGGKTTFPPLIFQMSSIPIKNDVKIAGCPNFRSSPCAGLGWRKRCVDGPTHNFWHSPFST